MDNNEEKPEKEEKKEEKEEKVKIFICSDKCFVVAFCSTFGSVIDCHIIFRRATKRLPTKSLRRNRSMARSKRTSFLWVRPRP